ncbi:anti-CBASS protein Acb1 family protein [Paenibacillus mesophilus]|uniref:anti-CBASS protein Acb1 family protein n=1 Tax=Paenibacillus mesophilus TaxID=2582849 RepID=UPI0013053B29|nr:anti-CBASS Acb1 family protein [Paenibacillus mesophilus]
MKRGFSALSLLMQRSGLAGLLGKQFGGRRNMYDVLGYNKNPRYDDYYARYERQDIAGNVIDKPASATWRHAPKLKEDDDENNETAFEAAWNTLTKQLGVNQYMERIDKLAGIGHYAVLLIGVRGSGALNRPLNPGSLRGPGDVLYLTPYGEKRATINKWDTNPNSARFGRPEEYRIDFAIDGSGINGTAFSAQQQLVHHSRVIHVPSEGLLEDEVFGRPRLKRVLNLLDNLEKVAGGSAEMFWQGAYKGLHADLRDDHTLEPGEGQKISEEIDEYIHGLRRYIRTSGMDLKSLDSEIADPTGHFEILMSLISGSTNIPKRILIGSERGELASSQDETNWVAFIKERQERYAEPLILRPLVDKLIAIGALPSPGDPYKVDWPDLFELDDKDRADIGLKKAQAIKAYAPFGETNRVVPVSEFREKVLGLEPDHPELEKLDGDDELDNGDDADVEFVERSRRRSLDPEGEEDV